MKAICIADLEVSFKILSVIRSGGFKKIKLWYYVIIYHYFLLDRFSFIYYRLSKNWSSLNGSSLLKWICIAIDTESRSICDWLGISWYWQCGLWQMGTQILPTLKFGHRWKRYSTVFKLMTPADDGRSSTVVKREKMREG